eukprot:scaffold20725_cov111-Isochrysis_galbana.AAC.21
MPPSKEAATRGCARLAAANHPAAEAAEAFRPPTSASAPPRPDQPAPLSLPPACRPAPAPRGGQ